MVRQAERAAVGAAVGAEVESQARGSDGVTSDSHQRPNAQQGIFDHYCRINPLLERWFEGDSLAGAEVYELYSDRIAGIVRFYLNPRFHKRVGIDDLVQSVFLTLLTKAQQEPLSFQSDASFGHWIRQFTKNIVRKRIQHERAKKRDMARDCTAVESLDLDGFQSNGRHREAVEGVHELRELVERAMDGLDDQHRRIVELSRDGFSQVEIADQMQLSTRTIRRRTIAIRQRFAELLS